SPSDYLVFSVDSVYLDTIFPIHNKTAVFKLDVVPDACVHSSADLHLIAGSGLYRSEKTVFEIIGLLMEDWETDGFTKFPWGFGGNANWVIDTIHYQGSYSARSGVIYNNQTSRLQVTFSAGKDDSISFYTKVSSEQDYDWLHFFIDDVPLGQWSGEQGWQRAAYPVTAGTHTFKWWYVTDISYLNGSNAAWIDNIVFPPPPLPNVYAGNDTTICAGNILQLLGTASSYDSLRWTTFGDGTFSNDTILTPIYTPGLTDVSSGSVKLRLKANGANGCYASSLHLAIAAIPVPHLTILPDDTVCGGQAVHLFADTIPGGHYLWTPGGFTTPEITVDTSLTGGFGSKWFRVRITNSSNCSSYDSLMVTFKDCTGIQETEAASSYEIFPNPNNGTFTLKIKNHSPGHVTLQLQNALNLMIFEDKDLEIYRGFIKTYKLNLLPPGIYILTLEDNEGKTNIKMIVK
ncbi:MAG TPA: T9SS type A sorting domain-containing protein, partial [Bacteroidales bacterium]|nr:T9SS type A sorting domain-containing protein [Bacteroidales bacterium]